MDSTAEEEPRFLADAMLGRLARWLRLLGYDTAYAPDAPDHQITARSLRERRVLLTRDRHVSRRHAFRVIVLDTDRVREQVRRVLHELNVTPVPHRFFTRCSACNLPLEVMEKTQAQGRVPARVFEGRTDFFRCPGCGKIYWSGSHRDLFLNSLLD
jgi:uncharacterized protein